MNQREKYTETRQMSQTAGSGDSLPTSISGMQRYECYVTGLEPIYIKIGMDPYSVHAAGNHRRSLSKLFDFALHVMTQPHRLGTSILLDASHNRCSDSFIPSWRFSHCVRGTWIALIYVARELSACLSPMDPWRRKEGNYAWAVVYT